MKEIITSIENQKIKNIRKLLENKNILKEKKFIIENDNLIEEAYKNEMLLEAYALIDYDNYLNLDLIYVSEKVMKSISDLKSTPKIIGISKIKENNELGEKIVLLDNVQDPGNIGTIIRNCVAFGVDTLVLSKDCANIYSKKVLRSCVGMIYNINIIIEDLENIIPKIKEKNIPVISTTLDATSEINQINKDKYAIIFGNEGNGIREELIEKSDMKVKIEMSAKCESLNVGVSSGIILYNIFRGKHE